MLALLPWLRPAEDLGQTLQEKVWQLPSGQYPGLNCEPPKLKIWVSPTMWAEDSGSWEESCNKPISSVDWAQRGTQNTLSSLGYILRLDRGHLPQDSEARSSSNLRPAPHIHDGHHLRGCTRDWNISTSRVRSMISYSLDLGGFTRLTTSVDCTHWGRHTTTSGL